MNRKLPDWVFKIALGCSAAIFALHLGGWLVEALFSGQYVSRGGGVISAAAHPSQFIGNVIGTAAVMMGMALATLASLGWIPAVGRIYKRVLHNFTKKRRSRHQPTAPCNVDN